MMDFIKLSTLLLMGLKFGASFRSIAENTCIQDFNSTSCVYNVYCHNTLLDYESFRAPYIHNYNYDDEREICGNTLVLHDTVFNKIYLRYEDDNIQDAMHLVPGESNDVNFRLLVVHLDLSQNRISVAPTIYPMENLQLLNFSHNHLTIGPLYNNNELDSLEFLDLSCNTINEIAINSSLSYKNLKTLNISHNYLVDLPDAIFLSLPQLEQLDLTHNFIDQISISTFEGVTKLTTLLFSHNRLYDINNSLFRFNYLENLDFSHNNIETIRYSDFTKLNQLRRLDLSYNAVTHLESTVFQKMVFLNSLYLNDNEFDNIEKDAFVNSRLLQKVDISKNNFKFIPRGLFRGKNVSCFSISGNHLEGNLEKGTFEGLSGLDKLDLSYQNLKSIEDYAFIGLDRIEQLILKYNNITFIAKNSFKHLSNLQLLDISHNKLVYITFDFNDLIKLNWLSLEGNVLSQIRTHQFQGLNVLQFLDISHNNITNFESNSFESLRDLINFEVSHNPLTGLLENNIFNGLKSLPRLDISCSQLTVITNESFANMVHLRDLNISHSELNELQYNAFKRTGSLEVIDLSFNKLHNFLINETDLVNLRSLKLNKNLLKSLASGAFYNLKYLNDIDMSYNKIEYIPIDVFNSQNEVKYFDISYNTNLTLDILLINSLYNLKKLVLSGISNGIQFNNITENQLNEIEICGSHIVNVTLIYLSKFISLEHIFLRYNNIVKLELGAFTTLFNLKSLDLSFNEITDIQPGIFKDNKELISLNLSHNFLEYVSYGIFRGLIYLNSLDISYNKLKTLESERFYEVPQLNILIVDHNEIDNFNVEEFAGVGLSELSIGDNPLPCKLLVNFNKTSPPFTLTAIKYDESVNENVGGITCKPDGRLSKVSYNGSMHNLNEKTLMEIKDTLLKIAKRNEINTTLEQHRNNYNDFDFFNNLTSRFEQIISHTSNQSVHMNNLSALHLKDEIKSSNLLLDKILKALDKMNSNTPKLRIVESNDTKYNDLVQYVNGVKREINDVISEKKNNILSEVEKKISLFQQSSLKQTPKLEKETTKIDNTTIHSSLFTETCVGLILFILISLVLYKFYKSRMFIRASRSYSTRELPGSMESPNL